MPTCCLRPTVSTTALAACVKRLTLLSTSHAIFLKDFSMDLTGMMRSRAILEGRLTPTLVEDEFTLHLLEEYGVVDRDLLTSISNDFRKLEAVGVTDDAANGAIEMSVLFEHCVMRGEILDSNRVAPGTTREERDAMRQLAARESGGRQSGGWRQSGRRSLMRMGTSRKFAARFGPDKEKLPDSVVDMSTPDRGFGEWLEDVWTPFLRADPAYIRSEKAKAPKHATNMTRKTIMNSRLSTAQADSSSDLSSSLPFSPPTTGLARNKTTLNDPTLQRMANGKVRRLSEVNTARSQAMMSRLASVQFQDGSLDA